MPVYSRPNSGADKAYNRSFDDTSMKFGMNILYTSLIEEKVLAIKNSNMAAIFFKMAASMPKTAIKHPFEDTSLKFVMNILCTFLIEEKALAIKNSNMAANRQKQSKTTKMTISAHSFPSFMI